MPSFWLDHDTTDEERLFRQSMRAFVEDFANPLEREFRKNPQETIRSLCVDSMKRGIRTAGIPEKYGGVQISQYMKGIATEELGRGLILDTSIAGGPLSGNELYFITKGPGHLVDKWITRILNGAVVGIASTEPKTGSDVATVTTTAKRRGGSFVINGEKGPASGISRTAGWIVIARTGDTQSGSRGLSEIFVEDDLPGVDRSRFDSMEESWDMGTIKFNDVEVPEDHLIG